MERRVQHHVAAMDRILAHTITGKIQCATLPGAALRDLLREGDPPPETKPADDPPPDVGEGVAAAEKVHDEVASQKAAQSQQSGFDVE